MICRLRGSRCCSICQTTAYISLENTSRRKKGGADEIQIQMAKTEADKESSLKELELQAQAQVNIDATSNIPPNRDARNCQLSWMRRIN